MSKREEGGGLSESIDSDVRPSTLAGINGFSEEEEGGGWRKEEWVKQIFFVQ